VLAHISEQFIRFKFAIKGCTFITESHGVLYGVTYTHVMACDTPTDVVWPY
jgi:hypothetical protein